jgi:lysosomal acid lipase/cholesteryl ester hydrolase
MDEFAFHDIPDTIAYILDTTRQSSLSYIGFSQGTAQAFASLAIHPKLNDQVNVFIALAPAMSPAGLSNGVVDALVKASPQVLFLLFGRRSILSSATMWQSILYPPIFVKVIDLGLKFLFKWDTKNISLSQKLAAYPHLYSFTSTKSVVHWFQIIRNKCFQMYDDDVPPPLSLRTASKYTKVAKFPTRNIKSPIVLVYGGSDSLVDIKVMLRELPPQTVATEIPHYEHLDFLWARDVDSQVFQHVFDALESFTNAEHTKEEYARYHLVRHESLMGSSNPYGHQRHESDATEGESAAALNGQDSNDTGTSNPQQHRARERPTSIPTPKQSSRMRTPQHHHTSSVKEGLPSSPDGLSEWSRRTPQQEIIDGAADDGPDSPFGSTKLKGIGVRRESGASSLNLEGRGITPGTSKAVGGVTKSGAEGQAMSPTTDNAKVGGGGRRRK